MKQEASLYGGTIINTHMGLNTENQMCTGIYSTCMGLSHSDWGAMPNWVLRHTHTTKSTQSAGKVDSTLGNVSMMRLHEMHSLSLERVKYCTR